MLLFPYMLFLGPPPPAPKKTPYIRIDSYSVSGWTTKLLPVNLKKDWYLTLRSAVEYLGANDAQIYPSNDICAIRQVYFSSSFICSFNPFFIFLDNFSWTIFLVHIFLNTFSWAIFPGHFFLDTFSWTLFPGHFSWTLFPWHFFLDIFSWTLFPWQFFLDNFSWTLFPEHFSLDTFPGLFFLGNFSW